MWGFTSSEREHELARLQLWLGTHGADVSGARRSYEVAPLGPVGAVEKWLLGAPARLEPFGYAVSFDAVAGGRWVGSQVRLDERSTLDLSGCITRPSEGPAPATSSSSTSPPRPWGSPSWSA